MKKSSTAHTPTLPAQLLVLGEIRLPDDQLEKLAELVAAKMPGQGPTKPVSPAELAELIGVSEDTIRRRIDAGLIKKVPDIGRVKIPVSEVDRLLLIKKNQPGGNDR